MTVETAMEKLETARCEVNMCKDLLARLSAVQAKASSPKEAAVFCIRDLLRSQLAAALSEEASLLKLEVGV